MMSLTLFKLGFAIIILLISVIAGLWPFIKRRSNATHLHFPISESLTSGIFLGAALLHMLPDAASAFIRAGYDYPYPFLLAAMVFLVLLLLEHINGSLRLKTPNILSSIVLLTVAMLSIHSLLEGAAIGIAPNLAMAGVIFIAIIAHKGAASFALAINLNRSSLSLMQRIILFCCFALMTPVGIVGGNYLLSITQHHTLLSPICNALAAGTFLYIGTLHGLERSSLIRYCCNMKEFVFLILGFVLMALVAIWT